MFFAGLLLKLVFAVWLGWLPVGGPRQHRDGAADPVCPTTGIYLIDAIRRATRRASLDVLQHAVLPAIALGLLTAGVFLRLVRTNVHRTLRQPTTSTRRARVA